MTWYWRCLDCKGDVPSNTKHNCPARGETGGDVPLEIAEIARSGEEKRVRRRKRTSS